ncbi:TetR/AcrR family transcriptional regulator [Oceanobacillus zhaokaii]|nr:TetR-like C-terminal domain-containing protein [Oceanobacillus zhaokaii]
MTVIDPRQVRSIKKLQEAYLSLLLSGHHQLTIRQLCQEANVTRPTFYNNYSNILDLRKQLHEEILHDLNKSLTIINPKPIDAFTENELPENMVNLFKHISENKKAYEVLLLHRPDSLFINDVKNILRKYIVEGMKYASSKEQEMTVKIPFAVSFITGAYYESIIWWLQNNYRYSPKEMAKLLLKISLYGPFERES